MTLFDAAPIPADETERLDALARLDVLDTPADPVFDDIAWMAAQACGTPIGLVSLVDRDRQWFKARFGLEIEQTPRGFAFCSHAILDADILEVPDALDDSRFAGNPLVVAGPRVRFYAGMPLTGRDGHRYGTLCVLDTRPRRLVARQRKALERLAGLVVSQLEAGSDRRAVQTRQQTLAQLLEAMPDGVVSCDANGLLGEFNSTARAWHGADPRALPPEEWARHFNLFEADGLRPLPTERVPLLRAWNGEQVRDAEIVIKAAGQPPRSILCNGERLVAPDGRPLGAVCVLHDITGLKATARQLAESEERLRVTLESIGEAVVTTDNTAAVTYANPTALTLLGLQAGEIIGRPIGSVFRLLPEHGDEPAPCPVTRVLEAATAGHRRGEHVMLRPDGTRMAIEDTAAPIRGDDGLMCGVVLVFRDVTTSRELARRISHQARHDALTDLANRREFETQLAHTLDQTEAGATGHALFYIDLDQFKVVNDTCGHGAGDALLKQVGTVLRGSLRGSDLLARLGGDEFAVLLRGCPADAALRVAESLRTSLAALGFVWQDRSFGVTASIGLVPFEAGASPQELMSAADSACYIAKEKGRNRIHVHHAADADVVHRTGELDWASRLHSALNNDRFVLYGQKILPVSSNAEVDQHIEVLVRLRGEDGQMVPPMAFIPAAERYGLMPSIDRWVVDRALAGLSASSVPTGSTRLSINLSGRTLSDETFTAYVEQVFQRHRVPFDQICFEITETAAIANLAEAERFIRWFRAQGGRFSLDDFGSGMSSFGYLKRLPVDYLKIDGGFVRNLLQDSVDEAMVSAIHNVGHVMGLRTIAEFVECDATLQRLRQLGIHFAQGYGLHRPQALSDLV